MWEINLKKNSKALVEHNSKQIPEKINTGNDLYKKGKRLSQIKKKEIKN